MRRWGREKVEVEGEEGKKEWEAACWEAPCWEARVDSGLIGLIGRPITVVKCDLTWMGCSRVLRAVKAARVKGPAVAGEVMRAVIGVRASIGSPIGSPLTLWLVPTLWLVLTLWQVRSSVRRVLRESSRGVGRWGCWRRRERRVEQAERRGRGDMSTSRVSTTRVSTKGGTIEDGMDKGAWRMELGEWSFENGAWRMELGEWNGWVMLGES